MIDEFGYVGYALADEYFLLTSEDVQEYHETMLREMGLDCLGAAGV